jgi:hypothetical protein
VLVRRSNLIAVLCLIAASAPAWGWSQTDNRPPHGVRRAGPKPVDLLTASQSKPDAEAVASDTANGHDAPTPHAASQAPPGDEEGDYLGPPEEAFHDGPGQTAWYASHPNPNEPLGFSGAMMTEAIPFDPRAASGFFDQPYEPIEEPMDLDAPAPAVSSGEWVRDGFWYTQQSAVYMSRSVSVKNSVILAIDVAATLLPHDTFFLQIPLDMGFEPGFRSMLGRHVGRDDRNRDHSIEFTFLGLTHWNSGGGLASLTTFGLFTPIDPTQNNAPVFNGSTQQTFDQVSDFNSFELNYRIDRRLARDKMIYTRDSTWVRQADPALLPTVYAGLRYARIDENLLWLAETTGPAGTGSYLVTTHNSMVGPQVGGDLFYERTDWRVGIRTRAGAMVNWASQRSTVRILDANGAPIVPNRDEFVDIHDAAFIGEIGFVGAYHFRPNFALRVSYDLMWATNLALAQNQLTFNPALPAEISNSHSLFFQGLTLGFELVR